MTEELRIAIEALRGRRMTPIELEAQRISFAFGNAPSQDKGTKESVKKTALAEMN